MEGKACLGLTMRDLSVHKSRELLPEAKHGFEQILGRSLADDEEIAVRVSRPHKRLRENLVTVLGSGAPTR